jgi:phosphoribosyl 1,2-cyclic phosphodiesterase
MSYRVIASGSDGNAVLYHGSILVDCGVSFSLIKPHLYDLRIVLLTHEHQDHLNINTLLNVARNRPTLRIGCCEWMTKHLGDVKNVDVYEIGKVYDYGTFQVSPVKLYHDVLNCGYRIFKDDYKIFHATDTAHLQGISAKNYDLYCIEHNYDEETVFDVIAKKTARGEFCHEKGAVNSHLSEQAASDFIFKNKGSNYEVLRLHESKII